MRFWRVVRWGAAGAALLLVLVLHLLIQGEVRTTWRVPDRPPLLAPVSPRRNSALEQAFRDIVISDGTRDPLTDLAHARGPEAEARARAPLSEAEAALYASLESGLSSHLLQDEPAQSAWRAGRIEAHRMLMGWMAAREGRCAEAVVHLRAALLLTESFRLSMEGDDLTQLTQAAERQRTVLTELSDWERAGHCHDIVDPLHRDAMVALLQTLDELESVFGPRPAARVLAIEGAFLRELPQVQRRPRLLEAGGSEPGRAPRRGPWPFHEARTRSWIQRTVRSQAEAVADGVCVTPEPLWGQRPTPLMWIDNPVGRQVGELVGSWLRTVCFELDRLHFARVDARGYVRDRLLSAEEDGTVGE